MQKITNLVLMYFVDHYNNIKIIQYLIHGLLFFTVSFAYADETKTCKTNPMVIDECFEVRGRLGFYNGAPSMRLWPIHTNRLLGISEGKYLMTGYANISDALSKQISFGKAMYANFEVCPFTRQTLGVMQYVCVESAKNITIKPWH